ncbi:hypothetical protein F4859DRAFT_508633 [Xylaria cf. heliscus]|nr:hypothetical protein F4859DRAFT_508633 [Xylaria cf. heliscus]
MALPGSGNGVIVIGIDFGTTFTGVAYNYVRPGQRASDIEPLPVTLWPSSGSGDANTDCPKVPSRITYPACGNITWGQQESDEQGTTILWSKLLLLDEPDLQSHLKNSNHIKQARESIEKTGKDVVTVISDYLSKVWEQALEAIIRARGRQFVSTNPFQVVVTVPAIWQDYAVQRMERVLTKAGILNKRPGCPDTTYTFVSEPEAAALAAIHGHHKYGDLELGQSFVIADLGGGTVSYMNRKTQDLVSFRVKATQPQLVLEEVVEGEGGLCGATFLDQAFLACLEKKVQQKKWTDRNLKSWQQMHELERKRIIDIVWERGIKRKYYDGQPGQRIDLGAQGNRRPDVLLDGDDLNHIFDSVCTDILKLVDGQVRAIIRKTGNMPQFIVLNGGFGRCEYVYRKLHLHYEDSIEVLFEANDRPWTAVARGAVFFGAAHMNGQAQVQSHVSRYSYGWAKMEDFNHLIHDPEDLDTDELTGRCVAQDQMEWIILRGESVETRKPRIYEYARYFEADEIGFVSFSEPIYRSSLRTPPKRLAENEAREDISNSGAEPSEFQEFATIDMTTPVPVEQLPKRGGKKFPHRELVYRVEVNVSGARLVIKATSLGKKIGKKVISELSD